MARSCAGVVAGTVLRQSWFVEARSTDPLTRRKLRDRELSPRSRPGTRRRVCRHQGTQTFPAEPAAAPQSTRKLAAVCSDQTGWCARGGTSRTRGRSLPRYSPASARRSACSNLSLVGRRRVGTGAGHERPGSSSLSSSGSSSRSGRVSYVGSGCAITLCAALSPRRGCPARCRDGRGTPASRFRRGGDRPS